jgi:hypothetical protein
MNIYREDFVYNILGLETAYNRVRTGFRSLKKTLLLHTLISPYMTFVYSYISSVISILFNFCKLYFSSQIFCKKKFVLSLPLFTSPCFKWTW